MIAIIARSARIEAASLAEDREGLLAFTKEAHELAKAVQESLEACGRDQDLLFKAVEVALGRQKEFELGYHAQLISEASELTSAYSSTQEQREISVHFADLAGRSATKVAEAVGRSIVSLQAGDSTAAPGAFPPRSRAGRRLDAKLCAAEHRRRTERDLYPRSDAAKGH